MFKILHEINPFGPMSCPETCDVRLIFLLTFFLCPHNYYHDNNILLSKQISLLPILRAALLIRLFLSCIHVLRLLTCAYLEKQSGQPKHGSNLVVVTIRQTEACTYHGGMQRHCSVFVSHKHVPPYLKHSLVLQIFISGERDICRLITRDV